MSIFFQRIQIVLLFILLSLSTFADKVSLIAEDTSLSQILLSLNIPISYDHQLLDSYVVTINSEFNSQEDALDYLLLNVPFEYSVVNEVYVITYNAKKESQLHSNIFSATILSKDLSQVLPYVSVGYENFGVLSDKNGMFSISLPVDSILIHLNYIGYVPIDTLIFPGVNNVILMNERNFYMDDIVLSSFSKSMLLEHGNRSGEIRINRALGRYLPGSSDNSVFNLLNLMPGVRAAGEPSEDFIVWNSFAGESKILFDGIQLFGMKSFNPNISYINPYMIKEIQLKKAGYGAFQSDVTGSVVSIISSDGDRNKPTVSASLNTQTMNVYASLPLGKKHILSAAFRRTFYDLYEDELFNPQSSKKNQRNKSDNLERAISLKNQNGNGYGNSSINTIKEVSIEPNYTFMDINLKLNGSITSKDKYAINLYYAKDIFDYTYHLNDTISPTSSLSDAQLGYHLYYNYKWSYKHNTTFDYSSSNLDHSQNYQRGLASNKESRLINYSVDSYVGVQQYKLVHQWEILGNNPVILGLEYKNFSILRNQSHYNKSLLSSQIQQNLRFSSFGCSVGARLELFDSSFYLLPDISFYWSFFDRWNLTGSFGMHRQYLNKNPFFFNDSFLVYQWDVNESLSSTQSLLGLGYGNNGWLVSTEIYNKALQNTIRIIDKVPLHHSINLTGVDVLLKKENKYLTGFISYSHIYQDLLSTNIDELKLGMVLNYSKWHLASSVIYGSGYLKPIINKRSPDYFRWDASLTYTTRYRQVLINTGISCVNVTNRDNPKYSYHVYDMNDPIDLYSNSFSFVPLFFFEISY